MGQSKKDLTPVVRNPGYVYFVKSPTCRLIKIGYSAKHPDARFCTIQVDSPDILERLGYIRGFRSDEDALKKAFAGSRDHGEWFRITDELLAVIRERAEPWAAPQPKARQSRAGIRWGKLVPLRKLPGYEYLKAAKSQQESRA